MKIVSWNVNGIRAAYKKGFIEFIEREDPDLLCVQETKAHREQCEPPLVRAAGRESLWSSAVRKGYSGVATFFKQAPLETANGIGLPATKNFRSTIFIFPTAARGLNATSTNKSSFRS